MNDVHGHYVPYQEKGFEGLIGGFGKAATLMAGIRARNSAEKRETLTFLSGDLLMGTPFSTAFKGKLGVELMNEMAFTTMAAGNHEFDYGQDNLLAELKPLMKFPLLSANIKTDDGRYLFDRLIVKQFPGSNTRVVIFGLTTPETPVTTHPKNVKGLIFEDPIKTAQELLKDFDEKDLIIAVTHLGKDDDEQLARGCPKIDVIVGGHTHTSILQPIRVGDTLICQAGAYAKYLGRLDIDAEDGKIVKYHGELMLLSSDVKRDEKIEAIIADHAARMDARLKEVIGKTEVFLEGTRSVIRSGKETDLGRLVTHIMTANAKSDAAVINGGAIRGGLLVGEITLGDVYTVLPFPSTVVRMDLPGKDLESVLQRSIDLEEGSGGKLQTFGLEFKVTSGKVKIEKIGGQPFDRSKTYSLATNDFLAAGGDGYSMLKEKGTNLMDTGQVVSDLIIDFIRDKKVLTRGILDSLQ